MNTPYSHPSMPGTAPDVLPRHISILPEPEQGPALVNAILDRKRSSEGEQ